jgi:group I intron endonuclease
MRIYMTTNKINGKIYIGKDALHRKCYLGSGKILKKAIKKYGRNNFVKTIIEICDDNRWVERERYWIDKYESRNPNIGYNITEGGEGISGHKHTEMAKKRMAETKIGDKNPMFGRHHLGYWLGKHHSKEANEKRAAALMGEKNHNFGKKFSDETLKKLSDSHKGHHPTEETLKKMSEVASGTKNGYYGKRHSEEVRKRMSEIAQARFAKLRKEKNEKHLCERN